LCHTASGIITVCRWPSGAHVEEYNKLVVKQEFVFFFLIFC